MTLFDDTLQIVFAQRTSYYSWCSNLYIASVMVFFTLQLCSLLGVPAVLHSVVLQGDRVGKNYSPSTLMGRLKKLPNLESKIVLLPPLNSDKDSFLEQTLAGHLLALFSTRPLLGL